MPQALVSRAVRIRHLTDSTGILRELRSLYRDARRGALEPSEATRLAYILKIMSEIMSLRDMEARLDAIEAGRPPAVRRISA